MKDIQNLLELQPAFSNLFEATVTSASGGSPLPRDHKFLCSKINFSGAGLEFDRNKTTKLFQVAAGYKYADEVSITWKETSTYAIRAFHQAWFDRFYDRAADVYRTGTAGKFYNININLMEGTKSLVLYNVIPATFPNLDLSYDASTALEYTLSYKVESWVFE